MGFTSLVLQVVCLRLLLSVFSGNELDIAITLAVWLVATGIGSFTGWRLREERLFPASFLLMALFAQAVVIVAPLIPDILSFETGEVVPLGMSFLSTVLLLALPCLVVGYQFPAAVRFARERPATVYGLEALGAFLGGVVFTFVFSGRLDAAGTAVLLGVLNILVPVLLTGRRLLLLILPIPLLLFSLGEGLQREFLEGRGMSLTSRVESPYGEIVVLRMKGQENVFVTGKFHYSYPDRQSEELRSHLPASLHPSPGRVLLVGGSPAVVRDFLRYPETRSVHYVELDPKLLEVSLALLSDEDREALRDARANIIADDARNFVRHASARYDLVVMNVSEPSTGSLNRFYTVEFFEEVRRLLGEGGMLTLRLPTFHGYMSRGMRMLNGTVRHTLDEVFQHVEASSGEYGYLFASPSPIATDPDMLERRFAARNIETLHFKPYVFHDAFAPLQVEMLKGRLAGVREVNTDDKPVAYLYSLLLWAEAQGEGLLASVLEPEARWYGALAAVLILAVLARASRRRVPEYFVLFTTGYSVMAFTVVILLRYQASYGYVYERIGLLSALVMVGLAAGSLMLRKVARPFRALMISEGAFILVFAASPVLFLAEMLSYVLCFVIGIIGGMEFAVLSRQGAEEDSARAGKLYGVDLAGSFLGAFVTAVPFIPHFGIRGALLFLIVMKTLSLAVAVSMRKALP
jgi:predicted membrane-bound spermidine synthase